MGQGNKKFQNAMTTNETLPLLDVKRRRIEKENYEQRNVAEFFNIIFTHKLKLLIIFQTIRNNEMTHLNSSHKTCNHNTT